MKFGIYVSMKVFNGVVTFCAICNFKMAASWGQNRISSNLADMFLMRCCYFGADFSKTLPPWDFEIFLAMKDRSVIQAPGSLLYVLF